MATEPQAPADIKQNPGNDRFLVQGADEFQEVDADADAEQVEFVRQQIDGEESSRP